MSHYRNLGGGRRDANEPEIMKRFLYHGWHPEQVSGNRQWDLNAYPPTPLTRQADGTWRTLVCHVDVKGPKGKIEETQEDKWSQLASKGVPVYVVRTEADVDALVAGTLSAWEPPPGTRATLGYVLTRLRVPSTVKGNRKPASNYTPPRGERMDAAKVAEEAFAPSFQCPHGPACVHGCRP